MHPATGMQATTGRRVALSTAPVSMWTKQMSEARDIPNPAGDAEGAA